MSAYVLGHADPELERLARQGEFLRELTRDVFVRAGIGPGDRVLDFGAGAGDVSLLLAELVGPTGRVYAVDRAPEAVDRARARLDALGVDNVEVFAGDDEAITDNRPEGGFDAVVGRLVLLHQRDPAAAVARLAAHLRPGGVVAFHEIEIDAGAWSVPHLPLLHQCFDWIVATFQRGGMVGDISARIADGFDRAGLRDAHVIREGRVEAGETSGAYEFMARTVRSLLPPMAAMGIVTADEVGIDTLEERLRAEAVAARARFTPAFFTAAWAWRR